MVASTANTEMAKALLFFGLILLVIVLVVVFLPSQHRSDGPHGVTLTRQPPPAKQGIAIVGHNVYRRASDRPTFVKIAEHVQSPYEDNLITSGRT